MRKIIIILSPKAFSKILPEHVERCKKSGIRFEVTDWVYAHMLEGWTRERCDNTMYAVDEEEFLKLIELDAELDIL